MSNKPKTCAECNKPIYEAVVMALGKCWHKEHFTCAHCKKPLNATKYIQENDKAYCEPDWKTLFQIPALPRCAQCNSPIEGTVMNALGKTWHKDHFVCAHCQKPFGKSKFYTENDLPYCEADYKKLFQGKKQGATSGAPSGTQSEGKSEPKSGAQSDALEASGGLPMCAQCNKPITDTVTHALGRTWHKEHFVCAQCKKPFNDASFYVIEGKPYCHADHKKLSKDKGSYKGGDLVCAQCNKAIEGTVLTALGKHYHVDHLMCAHCNKPIKDSSFNIHDNKPYCDKDYTTLFRKKCSGCGEKITDTVLTALQKPWHKKCFTCKKCKKPINAQEGFSDVNGQPFCVPCAINI